MKLSCQRAEKQSYMLRSKEKKYYGDKNDGA